MRATVFFFLLLLLFHYAKSFVVVVSHFLPLSWDATAELTHAPSPVSVWEKVHDATTTGDVSWFHFALHGVIYLTMSAKKKKKKKKKGVSNTVCLSACQVMRWSSMCFRFSLSSRAQSSWKTFFPSAVEKQSLFYILLFTIRKSSMCCCLMQTVCAVSTVGLRVCTCVEAHSVVVACWLFISSCWVLTPFTSTSLR